MGKKYLQFYVELFGLSKPVKNLCLLLYLPTMEAVVLEAPMSKNMIYCIEELNCFLLNTP